LEGVTQYNQTASGNNLFVNVIAQQTNQLHSGVI